MVILSTAAYVFAIAGLVFALATSVIHLVMDVRYGREYTPTHKTVYHIFSAALYALALIWLIAQMVVWW